MMITACRKNKDTSSPQVDILSPVSTSSYTYNDDLPVRIVFSDDQTLDQLQIELVSTNNNKVFFASTLYPTVATYIFDEIIPLRDRYWPEGKMFVRATASDGINTSTQIQEFYYGEAPLSIDNEWRVIHDGQGYMILDSDNQLIHSETKEYVGGGYEPRTGKYWIAHSDGSLINRSTSSDYTLSTFTLATIPVTTYYGKEREEYFIGCANGSIWKWQNGNVQSFVLGDNKNVRQITANKSHLFVWMEEPVTGQDYINIYNIETGAAMNSVIATYDLTSIGKYSDEEIIIAGNIKGTSHFGFLVPDSESIIQNYAFTRRPTPSSAHFSRHAGSTRPGFQPDAAGRTGGPSWRTAQRPVAGPLPGRA
ncbi:MAG: hypothetical protein ACKOW8_13575, partial [Flavobacteriales bacterium]